jgi:hypothetical protein
MLPWIIGETLCGASLNPGRPHYNMSNTATLLFKAGLSRSRYRNCSAVLHALRPKIAARKQEQLDDLVNSPQISGFKSQSNFQAKFKPSTGISERALVSTLSPERFCRALTDQVQNRRLGHFLFLQEAGSI